MSEYLNGAGYPIFRLYNGNTFVKEIQLPLTNSKGLIEDYTELSIQHEFLDYTKSKTFLGYHIKFTLNYDEWVSKDTAFKIFDLLYNEKIGRRIILIPRYDMPSRYFEVIGNNESMQMGIMKGGFNAIGHKGLSLTYQTKYISDWGIQDPDNVDKIILDFESLIIT